MRRLGRRRSVGTGLRSAFLALLVAMGAGPLPVSAQARASLTVGWTDGTTVTLRVSSARGYAAVAAADLAPLGWSVEARERDAVLTGPDGVRVEVRDESPYFRWNDQALQLVDAVYRDRGDVMVPLQFVTDFLPRRLPELYAYDGVRSRLLAGTAGAYRGAPPETRQGGDPSGDPPAPTVAEAAPPPTPAADTVPPRRPAVSDTTARPRAPAPDTMPPPPAAGSDSAPPRRPDASESTPPSRNSAAPPPPADSTRASGVPPTVDRAGAAGPPPSVSGTPADRRPGAGGALTGPRVVVIDAGHGGHDPGSIARNGLEEKVVALGVAEAVARRLRGVPGLEVHMIRDDDTFVEVWERGPRANEIRGERPGIFLSLHANSFNSPARGFETYFLSEARTEHERRVAAIENAPVHVDNGAAPAGDLEFILRELRNLDHSHWSALLAEMVQEEIADLHPGPNRGVKQAPLAVLTNALMPSVLVEIGYLSHPDEARLLGRADFQRRAGEAIADAVVQFFERYPPGTGTGGAGEGR